MEGQGRETWEAVVTAMSTVVTAVAACAAAWVYRSQAREMHTQSRLQTKSMEASNLLRLMVDVMDEEVRHRARRRVMVLWTEGVPLARWTDEDRRDGERVIRTFDLMGLMVRRELLDKNLVLETWGMRITQMYAATSELLVELRGKNGPRYMRNFEWLKMEAERFSEVEPADVEASPFE